MGLGKTIQTIGLIVSTMEAAAKRPTLIITPLALIQQWATEIRTKTEKDKISVLVYHGANRSKGMWVIVYVVQNFSYDKYK